MLSVNTNLAALQAQSAQQTNARSTATVMQQLSTSKRINNAVDDVAGLAISTRMMSQIKGANQAIRNANDGISLLQTAEGAIEGITNALQRMRELRVQSLSETNNSADKASIENEISSLQNEIGRIVTTTQFNGANLLDGTIGTAQADGNASLNFGTSSNADKTSIELPNFTSPAIVTPAPTPAPTPTPLPPIVSSTVTFSNASQFQAPNVSTVGSYGIATADINKDGKDDIAITNWADNTFSVFFGNGSGGFSSQATYPTENFPKDIIATDFNGDGRLDIAIANYGSPTLSIFLGNQNGTFSSFTSYGSIDYAHEVASADFNSDGKMDIVLPNEASNTISVFLNNGNGTFQTERVFATGATPANVAIADFNMDGKADLAVANHWAGTVSILLGHGDGNFDAEQQYNVGPRPTGTQIADLNSDGFEDLAFARNGSAEISVLTGNGDGSFNTPTAYEIGSESTDIASGDFNGDGKLDLVAANWGAGGVSILLGNGDSTFQAAQFISTPARPTRLSISDFNKDGKADVGFTSDTASNLYIALNQTTFPFTPPPPPPPPPPPVAPPTPLTLDQIDSLLATISKERASLGASISRLTYTVENLTTLSTKTQEAMSRIKDTDYSAATTDLAKRQIIQQAAMAMMAQANQNPQVILQLLKSTTS